MTSSRCSVIGHRGFKAKYTENTLAGFDKCFKAGAKSFETDVWTTKDHVLVISHDVNTKRIFCDENGNEADHNILETDYKVLKPLRTIASGEPLLRFTDVLHWFIAYSKEHDMSSEFKIMLDIKAANPPIVLKLLIKDMISVCPDLSWWYPRIQIGVWHLRFVKYLNQDPELQELFSEAEGYQGNTQFDLLHISLSWKASNVFLAYNDYLDTLSKDHFSIKTTGISIIYTSTWSPAFVKYFVPALRLQNMALYSWTINTRPQVEYFQRLCSYANIREYGVITDHPDKMVDYCDADTLATTRPIISVYKRFMSFLLMAVIKLPQVDDGHFDTYVEPIKTHPAKQTMGRKIFALLQHMGIF